MKVSLIITTLNSAVFLSQTLSSVQKQTKGFFELIIVEAGSNDGTLEIIEDFSTKLPIKLHNLPKSKVGTALNYGINKATGDILTSVDSDDILCADFCEIIEGWFSREPDVSYLYGNQIQNRDGDLVVVKPPGEGEKKHILIFSTSFISKSSFAIRRKDLIENEIYFDGSVLGNFAEDYLFFSRLIFSNLQGRYIDHELNEIRVHKESLSRQIETQWKMRLRTLLLMKRYRALYQDILPLSDLKKINKRYEAWSLRVILFLVLNKKQRHAKIVIGQQRNIVYRLVSLLILHLGGKAPKTLSILSGIIANLRLRVKYSR